jgi:hypothetical protein
MIFKKLNAGCGPDLINEKDWLNVDNHSVYPQDNFRIWDITTSPTELEHDLTERFEFVLLNHVLCTMNDHLAHKALINLHRTLKPGGKLQVIDMDILKVFKSYQEGRVHDIPIEEGSIDDRLCLAISGYGTRDSLYTPLRMSKVLIEAGFRVVTHLNDSEYDTRPNESLVIEATK